MSTTWRTACASCGHVLAEAGAWECSICGGPAVIRYDDPAEPRRLGPGKGVWRYSAWLPLAEEASPVSLGEGATPLVKLRRWTSRLGLEAVYAKLESCCPTGSFKDRGATVLVSDALANGARLVIEDSSGNAGAAIAAYAARAGVRCRLFAPAATPAPKLRQMRAYGAEVTPVDGARELVEAAAKQAGRLPEAHYAGHNSNPYFVERMKTLAYELAEAFDGLGPEHVVIPVGGGSLFVGAGLGFAEWQAQRLLAHAPMLHLVQAAGCMPLVAAFTAGAAGAVPVERRPTVAGGIEIERPARASLILQMLRHSGGSAVAVEDAAILAAQRDLAEMEGIFMEPTSAAAFAGLAELAAEGTIARDERVVVVVTGSGLKDL